MNFPKTQGDHALNIKSSWDQKIEPFRFYIPDNLNLDDPAPLVVCLHGKGADYNAWFDYTTVKDAADKYGTVLAAPQGRGNYWYRGAAEQDVLDIVAALKQEYKIDPDRIYLIGHSMGGWGTHWISSRNPGVFAATSPMSGFFNSDTLMNSFHTNPFLIHCADDDVVPVTNSRKAASMMSSLGANFRYREETGYAHSSKLISENLDLVFPWLLEHQRNLQPMRINHAVTTPRKGCCFWTSVLEIEPLFGTEFDSTPVLSARVMDNEITIQPVGIKQFALNLVSIPVDSTQDVTIMIFDQPEVVLSPEVMKSGWAVFNMDTASWKLENEEPDYILNDRPLKVLESKVAHLSKEDLDFEMAQLLAQDNGADFGLFRKDDFIPLGKPYTTDSLLDILAYPDDELVIIETTGREMMGWMDSIPGLQLNVQESYFENLDQTINVLCFSIMKAKQEAEVIRKLDQRPDQAIIEMALNLEESTSIR